MKKYFYLLMTAFVAVTLPSCSGDDDVEGSSELEKNYFSIQDGVYRNENFPQATTSETLTGVEMSDQVMNGAPNFITVVTNQQVDKFFVGVEGVDGYYEYNPNISSSRASSAAGYFTYIIPVMISNSYTGDAVLILSGRLANGYVTAIIKRPMHFLETKEGALEIKLAFSNDKDIDLHLITPSGKEIYYGDRGGSYTTESGEEITFGLDIDSNASCRIDGINKENIYLPEELIENGEYKVIVDMYRNCDPTKPTSWSVVTRYKGQIIPVKTGQNPATGTYPVNAPSGDMTTVMTFTINDNSRASISTRANAKTIKSIPLSDMDEMKLFELNLRRSAL